jgi:hypothetical protein
MCRSSFYTEYPGQAPQVIEDQVTYPLTTAMLTVPKSKVVRGFSFFGVSFVYVIFEDRHRPLLGEEPCARISQYGSKAHADRRHAGPRTGRNGCRLGLSVRPRREGSDARRELRTRYVASLQAADGHDIGPLLAFARS